MTRTPTPARRYKYVFQYYGAANKSGPDQVRFKGIAFSPDAVNWRGSEDNPILSPNESFEHENHFLAYVPYKGHWLLLYECAWYALDGTGKHGRYVGDVRLAHSRDGEHFTRVNPHEIFIAKGSPQEWDGQFIVITDKIVIKDDTIYLYYAGMGSEWTSWPTQNQVEGMRQIDPETGKGATARHSLRRMGLATLRLDGFTRMHVSDDVSYGSFVTRPIHLGPAQPGAAVLHVAEQATLTVNVGDTRPRWSWLEVEVLQADRDEVIAGFSRQECGAIIEDAVKVPVKWGGKSLADLAGKTVRLRFNFFGSASLYGFRIGG